jgi:hypothetical protein
MVRMTDYVEEMIDELQTDKRGSGSIKASINSIDA